MNLKEKMNSETSKMNNSTDITPKLNPQSRIQNLSSEILKLREIINLLQSDNQQKSEMIKYLNEQIGMLSDCDEVLKQNKDLWQKNRELEKKEQNAKTEMTAKIDAVKRESEKSLNALEKDFNKKLLNTQKFYRSKFKKLCVVTLVILLYGVLATIYIVLK